MTTRKPPDTPAPAFVDAVGDRREASDVAILGRRVLDVAGAGVPVFDVKPVAGTSAWSPPRVARLASVDEAAIGPATAEQLDVGIGDTVTIAGESRREVTIVGEALFPNDVHSGFTEGVWVTPETMRVVGPPNDLEKQEGMAQYRGAPLARRRRSGARRSAGLHRDCPAGAARSRPAEVPPELDNLRGSAACPSSSSCSSCSSRCRRWPTCSSRRSDGGGPSSRCCGRSGSRGA